MYKCNERTDTIKVRNLFIFAYCLNSVRQDPHWRKLFIRQLSFETNSETLGKVFSEFGEIAEGVNYLLFLVSFSFWRQVAKISSWFFPLLSRRDIWQIQ